MNLHLLSCLFVSCLFLTCSQAPHPEQPTAFASQDDTSIVISNDGKKAPTGVPVPAKGRKRLVSDFPPVTTTTLQQKPRKAAFYSNVRNIGDPRIISVPHDLPVITPGENGIPLPTKVPAAGKKVLALQSETVAAPTPSKKDDAVFNFQNIDGLLSGFITSFYEDRKGNIWIGSSVDGGVSRFDGQQFSHYNFYTGLGSHTVHSILEDRNGTFWFGTRNRNGLVSYDGRYFTLYNREIQFLNTIVQEIFEDSRGEIWFGGLGGGLIRFDGQYFYHYTQEHGLGDHTVNAICEDKQGLLWFGTTNGGLTCFDGKSFIRYLKDDAPLINKIWDICKDSRGRLWFVTSNEGVYCYEKGHFLNWTQQEGLVSNRFWSIIEDAQGYIWFCNKTDGLCRFDGKKLAVFSTREGLNIEFIRALLRDSYGNIWCGSWGAGINRLNTFPIQHFSQNSGLPGDYFFSLFEDSRGRLWSGEVNGIVSCIEVDSITHFTQENGFPSRQIKAIAEDHKGNIWIGTHLEGLYCFDGSSIQKWTKESGLLSDAINTLHVDKQGNLWIGCEAFGLTKYDGKSFTYYGANEGFMNSYVYSLNEDNEGNLWIGTFGRVSKFDGTHFTHYAKGQGLFCDFVGSIYKDPKGEMWFGTLRGGLYKHQAGRFSNISEQAHIPGNSVENVCSDENGNIWAFTRKNGLAVLVPDQSTSGAEMTYLTYPMGIQDGIFNISNMALQLSTDQNIWIGTRKGITKIDLNQYSIPQIPPKSIQLTDIYIQGRYVDFGRLQDTAYRKNFDFGDELNTSFDSVVAFYNYPHHLSLAHHLNHLTFHFSAIDWQAPHKLKFSFQLEGLEDRWSLPHSEARADYRGLKPGTYTFKVKAIGAAQIWTEPFSYTFTIRPPWWQSTLAWSIYVLLTMGLIYAMYRFLLSRQLDKAEARRLRELDQVKTRLYTNITHEFRTPLTVIEGMTEKVAEKPEKWLRQGTEMILRNSKQLLRLVNQMLDLSKLESGEVKLNQVQRDMIPFIYYLTESFQSFAEIKGVDLQTKPGPEALIMDYDPDRITEIVSNLLSNAIKFTPENGQVFVSMDKTGNQFCLTVEDTGIGIPEEQIPNIFDRFFQTDDSATRSGEGTGVGLALTRELVKLMQGSIEVESTTAVGTVFRVKLPITHQAQMLEDAKVILPQKTSILPPMAPSIAATNTLTRLSADKRPLLLLVEDNEDVVTYLQSCLEADYRLTVARDGQEGIEKAFELVPDLVITDVMMPHKDGFELCYELKQDLRSSHIPVIMLTAKADVDAKLDGLRRGADAYLTKPFNEEELLLRVSNLLELRQRLQARYTSLDQPLATDLTAPELQQEDAFILQFREIVETHLDKYDLDVSFLCEAMNLSRAPLHNKLKALTGMSTTEYVRFIRLNKAKELLKDDSFNISEVSYQVGFQDPNYFTRKFRELFGVTPKAWREG